MINLLIILIRICQMYIISTTRVGNKLYMHLVLYGLQAWQIAYSEWLTNLSLF